MQRPGMPEGEGAGRRQGRAETWLTCEDPRKGESGGTGMALTTCRECKAQISTTAESCPQCGAKPKKTSGCAIILVAFLGLVLFSILVRGCSGSGTATSTAAAPASQKSAPAVPEKADPAAVLAESGKTVDEIEARLRDNAERLKKYYGTPA